MLALALAACAPGKPGGSGDRVPATDSAAPDSAAPDSATCRPSLPRLHTVDPAGAEAGRALLATSALSAPLIPRVALDNLYWVWGTGRPADTAAFQAAFQDRYGLLPDPAGGPYALGVPALSGSMASIDCLICHADGVAGAVVVGAGSSRVDLQSLFDDLVALAALAASVGLPPVALPFSLDDRTLAAGTTDAYGLGMAFSAPWGPEGMAPETDYGGQQPAAWWQAAHKTRVYADGQGQAAGHRTMAAMLLAFGNSPAELEAQDAALAELWAAIQETPVPPWPFDPPAPEAADAGAAVYAAHCADCHGTVCGPADDRHHPDRVVPLAEVGTDPVRAAAFGEAEAAWINGSWFGAAHPVTATGGYLAPPLVGVWATAPYLHNGTVPDLSALLRPDERPAAWSRTGWAAADYDPVRVGWRTVAETPGTPPDSWARRRVVDTTRRGLSAAGHPWGTALEEADKDALIAFLKTL